MAEDEILTISGTMKNIPNSIITADPPLVSTGNPLWDSILNSEETK